MRFVAARCLWTAVVVAAIAVIPAARGLWLDLPSTGSKCVSEELHNNVVVLADYYAFIGEDYDVNNTINPSITVKVTSPYGNELYNKDKVSHGQFAFTTTEMGNYMACFSADGDHHGKKVPTLVLNGKLELLQKIGIQLQRKKKSRQGLELELKKLEEHVQTIHENINYLINREAEMREVSEKTNGRVAWYSIMSLGLCIVVSVFQLLYLRRYFQKKKLI